MKKDCCAPVYDIAVVDDKLAYAQGNKIHFDGTAYACDYNMHKLRSYGSYIFGIGKYTINIVNTKTKEHTICQTNTWVGDVNMAGDLVIVYTLRGESYKIDMKSIQHGGNIAIDKKQMSYTNKNKTFTAMCAYNNDVLCGSWNGCVTYNKKEHKIHAGTIFDINFCSNYIITCSTDRSVCVLNTKFDKVLQIYEYRSRIYKCGFVTSASLAEYGIQTMQTSSVLFYTLTECGKLRIYCNKDVVYEHKDLDASITAVCVYKNAIYIGYDDGTVEQAKSHICKYLGKADLFCANNDMIMQYHDNKIDNVAVNYKIYKLFVSKTNNVYFAAYKSLYMLQSDKAVLVREFAKKINNVYDNAVVFADTIMFTTPCYTQTIQEYSAKNVTSCYKDFFGLRNGTVWYKKIEFVVSKDAITGICEKDADLYMSCRDGYVYIVGTKTIQDAIYKHKDKKVSIKLQTKRKYITTQFLEGLFVDKDVYTYYFANNCLVVSSFTVKKSYKIGFRPKRYVLTKDKFLYVKNDDLYSVDIDKRQQRMQASYKHGCYSQANKKMYLCTPYHIFLFANNCLIDRLEIHDISVIQTIDKYVVVGTLQGQLHVCEDYNNMIVEVAQFDVEERVLDICVDIVANKLRIVYLLSSNALCVACYDGENVTMMHKMQKTRQYTTVHMTKEKSICIGSSNGYIAKYSIDKKTVQDCTKVGTMVIHKIVHIADAQIHIVASDDHTIAIVDKKGNCKTIACHSGPVTDFALHNNKYVIALGSDKTISVVDVDSSAVVKTMRTCVYKPAFLVINNDILHIFGCGRETHDMKEILQDIGCNNAI